MTEEFVYHVDDHDELIGKVSRKEMREKNLLHRGSAAFVFNSKGDILIHKRTKTKDLFPGYYDVLIGGGVEYGESYHETMIREAKEEIGIEIKKLDLLFNYKYDKEDNRSFFNIYKIIHDGPFSFQKEEIEFAKFVTVDELKEMMKKEKFCPDGAEILKHYLADKYLMY